MIVKLFLASLLLVSAVRGDSCYGRCGDSADHSKTCQCNTYCETKYDDCCSDYETLCKGSSDSCVGRCDDVLDNSFACQCNEHCERYGDCCSDYSAECTSSGGGNSGGSSGSGCSATSASNQDILTASDQLWLLDSNRASSSDVVVNGQAKTSDSSNTDSSPLPFFSYVNPDLMGKKTYSALIDLLDNYERVQGNDENFSSSQLAEQDAFLDAFVETEIGTYLFQFLQSKGKAGCGGVEEFKQLLKDCWFGLYSRKNGAMDTSGFEHVFVGEIKGSSVSGFHNWLSIYLQEKAGNLEYFGYTGYTEPDLWGLHFEWYGMMKGLSGSMVGSSPEYDLAVFSLCHILRPNSQCTVQVRDDQGSAVQQKIQTWTWSNSRPADDRYYVASAYFLA